jgi:peptidyl-prolyl cis-trans isomerase SurA
MTLRAPIRFRITLAFPAVAAACLLVLAVALSPAQSPPQPAASPSSGPVVLDRAVAVVNKQVILSSDLDDEIRLSVLEPDRGRELTAQEALEQLISRTLIEQQIREQDFQTTEPTPQDVDARVANLRKQLPACVRENCATDQGWEKFLTEHGLTAARVQSYIRYRLEILSFIEQRFRQGIQITQQQIETYYHDTLLPQYQPGETVPPLDQVSSRIQEILLEQQVNVLFSNWLANLRQQGEVEVLDPALAPAIESAGTPPTAAPQIVLPPAPAPVTSAPPTPEPSHP